MQNIYPAVKALIIDKEKFLAVKHIINGNEWWDLPGGKIEHGEDPYDTLLREVKEELGIDVTIMHPAGVWWFFRVKDNAQIVCTTFFCQMKRSGEHLTMGDTITETRWVTKEEFLSEKYNIGDESLKRMISKI